MLSYVQCIKTAVQAVYEQNTKETDLIHFLLVNIQSQLRSVSKQESFVFQAARMEMRYDEDIKAIVRNAYVMYYDTMSQAIHDAGYTDPNTSITSRFFGCILDGCDIYEMIFDEQILTSECIDHISRVVHET